MSKKNSEPVLKALVYKCARCRAIREHPDGFWGAPACVGTFRRPHRRLPMFLRGALYSNGAIIHRYVEPPRRRREHTRSN